MTHSLNFAAVSLLYNTARAGTSPLSNYWHRLTDLTFAGQYQLNSFDLLIMIPYFIVLLVLAAYGIHRYTLVYNFFKYADRKPEIPPPVAEWPKVTIQLPIFNERYVIERLVDCVSQFDYPRSRMEIQVLDDSTDETQGIAANCVSRHQALGLPISYIHRDNREGFKAGALQEGMKTATGDFIAIFDADVLPPASFLKSTLPYFHTPKLAMVQTRWSYINRNYSRSLKSKPSCSMATSLLSIPRAIAAAIFSISTEQPASGAARPSKMLAAGSMTL